MTTRTVTGNIKTLTDSAVSSGTVTFEKVVTSTTGNTIHQFGTTTATTDGSGDFSIALAVPASGSYRYRMILPNGDAFYFSIADGASVNVATLIVAETITDSDAIVEALAAYLPLSGGTMTGQLNFSGTTHAGIKLLTLTTAQRDALTPANGMVIYNSTTSTVQVYQGGTWTSVGGGGGASDVDDLTTTTGTSSQMLRVAAAGGLEYRTVGQVLDDLQDSGALATTDIGVSVQAYSAKTAAIAALTWAANSIILLTGTATASVQALAAHVVTFIQSATAADARTAIGAGTGNGDVTGPASSTDNAIPRFDLTTGKILQEGTGAPTYDDAGRISSVDMTLTETPGSLAASPTLAFGDGDTGFYESADDALRISIAGVNKFFALLVDGVYALGSVNNSGGLIIDRVPSAILPAFAFRGDYSTGLGYVGTSRPALISNGAPSFMAAKFTAITTAQTVIANGSGDVTLVLSGTFTVSDGAGNVAGGVITATAPSGTFNLYDDGGTNTLQLAIAADGSVTVARTAGSRTYACNLNLNWM